MMLHQNFKQINMKNFFVAAEFPKTPSPKPARIPPQTPPAGGKSVEAGRILSPRQIVSPCRVHSVLLEKGSRKGYNFSANRNFTI